MPSLSASLAAAALAGVLALASSAGPALVAAAVVLVQVVLALGGMRALGVPAVRASAWVAVLAGIVAAAWTYQSDHPGLTPLLGVLGPALVVAIVLQLLRRDDRHDLTVALAVSLTVVALTALPVLWLALRLAPEGEHSVGLALLGVGVVCLGEALPVSRAVRRFLGVIAAAAGAAGVVTLVDGFSDVVPAVSAVVVATFAGVLAAVAFAVVDRLAEESTDDEVRSAVTVPDDTTPAATVAGVPRGALEALAAGGAERGADGRGIPAAALLPLRVAMPFVAAAPAAYVLGRIFVG